MPRSQLARANEFRALHAGSSGFLIPNPWDRGSTRLLAQLGFKALATTSAGFSNSRGKPDRSVSREPMLSHLADMASATDLPLSADLERGFGASPEEVAETIVLAAAAGVVGGSIEDISGNATTPLLEPARAADRIRAAAEAARRLPFPFMLTARAENFSVGLPDLADTIARLQCYQDAGADVLFAPGITSRQDIATVLRSVDRPLNVLIAVAGMQLEVQDLLELGVRRISVGGSLARAAYGELARAATELQTQGTLNYAAAAIPGARLNEIFSRCDLENE
ncbi:MAG: isocitrate lyase/phosphoenolpyruvate mutase family protein [Burkholderiales bacterium]|nr:isocitrate lyase/phosphoenolpyruvate mutase family protein [Burkholderiales bacterium]